MIQACDSADQPSCVPLSTVASQSSTASSVIQTNNTTTTTTPTPTATFAVTEDFGNEDAESSARGSGQGSSSDLDASSSNLESQYPPDVKAGFDELCPVCGDKVSGYHYGLLTCESCKGFFKRTVQNKKVYSCVDNQQCPIDKSQRKRCPFCRFQKCLSVGMKLEAVRQDRMRGGRNKFGPMYKRDRAMKQQQIRNHQRIIAECEATMTLPGSPPDVKPDPALLQASLGMGFPQSSVPNHVDLSSMAAAMAAAVVGASSMDGMRDARDGMSVAVSSVGGGFPGMQSPVSVASSGVSRGMGGGGSPGGSSGALNLHSVSHHNGLHHHHHQQLVDSRGGGSHLPPLPSHHAQPPPHTHQHHHPSAAPPPPPQLQHHQPPPPNNSHLQQQQQPNSSHLQHAQQQSLGGSAMDSNHPYLLHSTPHHHHQQQHQHHHPHVHTPTTYHSDTSLSENGLPPPPHLGPPPSSTAVPEPGLDSYRVDYSSAGGGGVERATMPQLLCEIRANLLEEEEMKGKMVSFLSDTLRQMSSGGEGGPSADHLLHIVCGMVDQLLFLMVEWARSSPFFKEIRVEDQMKLLQHSWSEILILDFVYRQVHHYWGSELSLPNGCRLNFETLDKLGLGDVRVRLVELIKKCKELKLDYNEYMCLKFLLLLNSDISSLENRQFVEQSQEQVNAALLEYCYAFYPGLKDKFGQTLLRLPEIRLISIRLEEFLYQKHLNNQLPDQTLLTEMLHSRRK